MVNSSNKCTKCGGALIVSYGVRSCLNCGDEPMTVKERRQWWRSHKEEIACDVEKLGARATMKKWRLPRQLISHLYLDKFLPSGALRASARHLAPSYNLPKFPEFKDSWIADVQKLWLSIWLHLTLQEYGEEVAHVKDHKAGG